ncbi:MAG: protein disulfide oxidoreductase [Desulfomonilia bacterium]
MSELIDAKTKKELLPVLKHLTSPVRLVFFTQEHACVACREQEGLLKELEVLSDKIIFEIRDLLVDADVARGYGVNKVPATVVIGEKDYGIRFYGMTMGYEFSSLIEAILMVSAGKSGLAPETLHLLELIDMPVHLEVMVTLTCPYCPHMVHLAHQMAIANEHIKADMIESSQFPQLVQRYEVSGVPKTVINEGASFEGALPAPQAILEILKVVKPKEYEQIDAQMREAAGQRFVLPAKTDHIYDVIIIGAGPAALTAAIYATRKNLEVALIGESFGGQITNTASIENWLGIPNISGKELTAIFRVHAERYAIAEQMDMKVASVGKKDVMFEVATVSGLTYRAKSVIYCAGKEYRTLGVPGEGRFLGRGIAFCATCDAPLYRDRRVAVIGGGNSAFTAARDLLSYAKEIHIVNVLKDFQADPVLFEEVMKARHVTLHSGMRVVEFLGKERLAGVRLEPVEGADRLDLNVDGVFLEIGLLPNSSPVKDLVKLNDQGEIEVKRDQSTAVPGFFAAGDVTDETEKQIVVAAGAGAKAALTSYNYLLDQKLLKVK